MNSRSNEVSFRTRQRKQAAADLRLGARDGKIFRMLGQDTSLEKIAFQIDVTPSELNKYVQRVYRTFAEPDDAIQRRPFG